MTAANWARTVRMLRRMMARLREHDVQVIEPPNFDVPPALRKPQ
jgi:hypothetical protein